MCLAITAAPLTAQAEPAPNYAPSREDAWLAANDPDQFAWKLFSAINAPAGIEGSRDVVWETWPEQEEIYADPHAAPQWPENASRDKNLRPSRQHLLRALAANSNADVPKVRDGVANEEVRNNRAAFDYIVENELWYKEGVVEKVRNGAVEFPYGAIAIKAKWKRISEADKPRYHWQQYRDRKTREPVIVGLVALHIASRILPTWHWSTFEHVDNPGFADYIGVHDSFGMRPTDIWPNREPNQGYSEVFGKPVDGVGILTPELQEMMAGFDLGPALSRYYRLKGAQISFTDRTGRPTIVGNSITEAGFVATSSCVTCHARATVGAPYQGQNHFPVPPSLSIFTERGESFNGLPEPSWFWDPTAEFSNPPAVAEAYHKQVEFLWQLALLPKARNPDSDEEAK